MEKGTVRGVKGRELVRGQQTDRENQINEKMGGNRLRKEQMEKEHWKGEVGGREVEGN